MNHDVVAVLTLVYCTSLISLGPFVQCHFPVRNESNSEEFARFWASMDRLESTHNTEWRLVADRVLQIATDLNQTTSQCYQSIEATFRAGIGHRWSAELINANSFTQSNLGSLLLSEQYTSLGHFDQCISVVHNNHSVPFTGQYCLVGLETPQLGFYSTEQESTRLANQVNSSSGHFRQIARDWLVIRNRFPLTFAICVPSVCNTEQLTVLITKYFDYYLNGIRVNVNYCQHSSSRQTAQRSEASDLPFRISIALVLLFVSLSAISTALYSVIKLTERVFGHRCPSTVVCLVECFHCGRNFRHLFRVKKPASKHRFDLSFVHGIKVYFMSCVLQFHCLHFVPILHYTRVSLFSNYPSYYFSVRDGFTNNNLERGFLVVDIFFALSGLLVAYGTLTRFERRMPNLSVFVLSRWLRLMPSVLSTLCLTIVVQRLGSGPLFHTDLTDAYVSPCVHYWWTHLLFISNFWTIDKMCGPNLWFVSTDFQLHILLYPILFLYYRKRILLFFSSFSMIIGSVLLFIAIVLFTGHRIPYNDYTANFQFEIPLEQIRLFYTTPLLHIIPYFVAVIVGVILIKITKKPNYSSYYDHVFLVLFVLLVVCHNFPLMPKYPQQTNHFSTVSESFVFLSIYIVHALLLVCLFVCLTFSSAKFWIRRLLSSHFVVPLSRLSYGIYLVNILLIWYNVHQNSQVQQLTTFYIVQLYFVVYFESILLAMFIYVLVEAPFNNIFRLFLSGTMSNHKSVPVNGNPDIDESHLEAKL